MLNNLVLSLGVAAVVGLGGFKLGWDWNGDRYEAKLAEQERVWVAAYTRAVEIANEHASLLITANNRAATRTRELQERVRVAPSSGWTVTDDDRRLWNDALCQGLPADQCGASAPAGSTDAAPRRSAKRP